MITYFISVFIVIRVKIKKKTVEVVVCQSNILLKELKTTLSSSLKTTLNIPRKIT